MLIEPPWGSGISGYFDSTNIKLLWSLVNNLFSLRRSDIFVEKETNRKPEHRRSSIVIVCLKKFIDQNLV